MLNKGYYPQVWFSSSNQWQYLNNCVKIAFFYCIFWKESVNRVVYLCPGAEVICSKVLQHLSNLQAKLPLLVKTERSVWNQLLVCVDCEQSARWQNCHVCMRIIKRSCPSVFVSDAYWLNGKLVNWREAWRLVLSFHADSWWLCVCWVKPLVVYTLLGAGPDRNATHRGTGITKIETCHID